MAEPPVFNYSVEPMAPSRLGRRWRWTLFHGDRLLAAGWRMSESRAIHGIRTARSRDGVTSPTTVVRHDLPMAAAGSFNRSETDRYLQRIGDRFALDGALLGGAQIDDLHGAGPQRERGPEWVVVLISSAFDGVPWLERVHQAGALWDASEMGGHPADVHCYTPAEFGRKREALRRVREVAERGIDLMAAPAA